MTHIIFGQDEAVMQWLAMHQTDNAIPIGNVWALGLVDKNGQPGGAITIVQTSAAGVQLGIESYGLLTRQVIRDVFAFVFGHLGVSRCEIVTKRTNKVMKKHAPNTLGFRFEGVRRDYYGPGEDGLAFVMQPNTCKWIEHGKSIQRAA